jgi:hypothetical protein
MQPHDAGTSSARQRQEPTMIEPEPQRPAAGYRWPAAPEAGAERRLGTALLVFVVVALAWPWYAWFVQDYLDRRMMAAAAAQIDAELAGQARQLQRAQSQAQRARAAQSRAQRIAAVQVAGVGDTGAEPVVVVRLGESNPEEARAVICRQAADWLRRPTAGTRLRIQRHNGDQPAIDAGTLQCP